MRQRVALAQDQREVLLDMCFERYRVEDGGSISKTTALFDRSEIFGDPETTLLDPLPSEILVKQLEQLTGLRELG